MTEFTQRYVPLPSRVLTKLGGVGLTYMLQNHSRALGVLLFFFEF
jgi:hypothetical protein